MDALSPPSSSTALIPFVASPMPKICTKVGKQIGQDISTNLLPKVRERNSRAGNFGVTLKELDLLLNKYEGMARMNQMIPKLQPLLARVAMNQIQLSAASVNAPLSSLTGKEAMQIGQSLAPILATSAAPASAVDEWIMKYPALGELDSTIACFRPMVNEIAKTLLSEAKWGARMRLYFGAGLSAIDMVSDFNVVLLYWATGRENDGNTLLTCLLLNVIMQLVVVLLQNWKAPLRVLLWELFYVLSCTKVGVDAYRVAAGVEMEAYHLYPPDIELCKHRRIPLSILCNSVDIVF
jgi:hypothetical protein